jgi:hypothetical protein
MQSDGIFEVVHISGYLLLVCFELSGALLGLPALSAHLFALNCLFLKLFVHVEMQDVQFFVN